MDYQIFDYQLGRGKISYGYTYRTAGKFKTNQSILNLMQTLYFPPTPRILIMNQEHTNNVSSLDKASYNPITIYPHTDGLFYPHAEQNVFLIVKTADCLPIVVWDKKGNLGVAHAGWRGSLDRVLSNLLQHFLEASSPKDIFIFMGPSIGACCYPLYGPRLKLFQEAFPDWQEKIVINYPNHQGLDLKKLNFLQASQLGIPSENITFTYSCTACQSNLFYSYVSDGAVNGNIISWIGITSI